MGKAKYSGYLERKEGVGYCIVAKGCKENWPMPPGAPTNRFTSHFENDHPNEWKVFQELQKTKEAQTPKPAKRKKLNDSTASESSFNQLSMTPFGKFFNTFFS
jgi:hypothetical protein